MFEDVPGRLMSGALWGLGAGIVLSVVGGRNADANRERARSTARPLTKALMKAYFTTAERVRDVTSEARENLGDIVAEVKAERRSDTNGAVRDIPVGLEDSGTNSGSAGESGSSRRSRARSSST